MSRRSRDDAAAAALTSVAAALTPRVWAQIGRLPIPRSGDTHEGFGALGYLRDGETRSLDVSQAIPSLSLSKPLRYTKLTALAAKGDESRMRSEPRPFWARLRSEARR